MGKQKQKMYHAKGLVKRVGKSVGLIEEAIISSEVVDRMGEVIKQNGIQTDNFMKNPVLLWAHNSGLTEARPPIGKVVKTWISKGKLRFTAQFDLEDPFAKMIYNKYKKGFLNAFSIGFQPLDKDGDTYTKVDALEFSAVPVPANPEALVQLRSMVVEPKTWKDLYGKEKKKKKALTSSKPKPKPQPEEKKEKPVTDKEILEDVHGEMRILYAALGVALKKVKENKRRG